VIELVTREEILPLRHAVPRPNLPIETAKYHPDIFHPADRADGTVIPCVTFLPHFLVVRTPPRNCGENV
jgi:hypothetical protein